MNVRRKIPYGVMNYEKLIRECYFVDNTSCIRELENVETPVFLRPKRFGKSVWCSVLAHYYDVNLKGRFQELFGETDIGKDPTPLANAFLVLRFDFSTIEVGTLAEIERNFFAHVKLRVKDFAVRYAALADWTPALAAENPAMMIDQVRGIVQQNGLPPVYVIIDEYDNFTNELVVSNRDAEYDAICGHDNAGGLSRDSFFKAFYDGYHFIPGSEPLYNSTICNWYLQCFVAEGGRIPRTLIDTNVRTDVGWIRRLADVGRAADVLHDRDGVQHAGGALRLPRDAEAGARQGRDAHRVQVLQRRGGEASPCHRACRAGRGDARAGEALPRLPAVASRLGLRRRDRRRRGLRQPRLPLVPREVICGASKALAADIDENEIAAALCDLKGCAKNEMPRNW